MFEKFDLTNEIRINAHGGHIKAIIMNWMNRDKESVRLSVSHTVKMDDPPFAITAYSTIGAHSLRESSVFCVLKSEERKS